MAIVKYGNPILSEIASPVYSLEERNELKKKLWKEYVMLNKPQGLAAPQINISKCAVICRLDGIPIFMFNPIITHKYGRRKSNEGCESVIGRYIVNRPLFGRVTYVDLKGHQQTEWFTWKQLRVICHEVDHLLGICICDRK